MRKQPNLNGMAASESLYSFDESNETDSKIALPSEIINPRPALIPGVEYPTTEREERLLDLAYAKGRADTLREICGVCDG